MERQSIPKADKVPTGNNHLHRQSARSTSAGHSLLNLQGSIGNQAVQRLIASPYIRTKLQISTPGDPFEQEADRVADTVMRMTVQREPEQPTEEEQQETIATKPVVQRVPSAVREDDEEEQVQTKPLSSHLSHSPRIHPVHRSVSALVQRLCTQCEEEKQQDQGVSGGMVHRKSAPEQPRDDDDVEEQQVQPSGAQIATPKVSTLVAGNIHAMNGGGYPLRATSRAFFEPRFGTDFSQVRVHTDSRAAETANSIQARAFTVGPNIAFGPGQYAPESSEGKQLLAHELTHVVQQNGSQDRPSGIQRKPKSKEAKTETKPPVAWRDGMHAKVVKEFKLGDDFSGYEEYKVGEVLKVTSEPTQFYGRKSASVTTVRAAAIGRREGTSPRWISVDNIEPTNAPVIPPGMEDAVNFQVDVLSADAARAMGIDLSIIPENTLLPLAQAQAGAQCRIGEDPFMGGMAPGMGAGWAGAPWPAFPIPANATGVQWTQTGFGHFSQFSNVPGSPTMGGYRSYGAVHGYQGLHSAITRNPWTRPVPGGYFSDWWFRLMSSKSQTLIWRPGTPQHAALVAELIKSGSYSQRYNFPPAPQGQSCSNCITVPKTQTYGALGGRPVIVTDEGVFDITEFGRDAPDQPMSKQQAGRGRTMREWINNPKVQTPTGQIETLNTSRVPASTVAGNRGVAVIRAGGIVLLVYGAYKTGDRLAEAYGTPEFGRVVAQETGSWVGGIIAGALGAAGAGAVACSPSGPGAFVCAAAGFAGGLIAGVAGSMVGAMGGDYLYDKLSGGLETANEVFSPMVERYIWGDKPIREMGYYPPRQYGDNPFEYEQEKRRYMEGHE